MKKHALALTFLALLLWTACDDISGSSESKLSSNAMPVDIEAESYDDLPNCSVNREGKLATTKNTENIYKCSNKQWELY